MNVIYYTINQINQGKRGRGAKRSNHQAERRGEQATLLSIEWNGERDSEAGLQEVKGKQTVKEGRKEGKKDD